MIKNGFFTLFAAGLATAALSSEAGASGVGGGLRYLEFETSGGALNPGVDVAFNPQPDPPGVPTLDLADQYLPVLRQPGQGTFDFVFSFTGLPGLLLPAVQKPNADGVTNFTFEYGGNVFDVGLTFSGPGGAQDWVAFNPQPDPPGVWFADSVTFPGDPKVSFDISENGTPLSFTPVPEASTWAMMGLGFGALAGLSLLRGKIGPPAAAPI